MNELNYVQGLLLGIVQGLTEFLPVSSSAHLVIVQKLFGLKGDAPEILLFDVISHLGTLLAMLVVFAGTFQRFLSALVRESLPGYHGRHPAWLVAWLTIVACVPTAAIGFGFKDYFEASFDSLFSTGLEVFVTGGILFVTGFLPRPRRGWRRIGWWRAGLIGVAQGVAILPGISRSGSTIATALMLGVKRRWAAEFSFLIAMPPILGACTIKLWEALDLPSDVLDAMPWGPILVGSAGSFLVGVGALLILLRMVVRDKLQYFCYYCWPLGVAVIIWSVIR